ncbi:MAG: Flp family type IVb pilin [Planctomycetaceae bacterium]|nr:Flp family type IVb pilin [Planctomycetaceae bacterium]
MADRTPLQAFLSDDEGTTAVEYCVMLAMILLAIIVGLTAAGNGVLDWWTEIDTELQSNGF